MRWLAGIRQCFPCRIDFSVADAKIIVEDLRKSFGDERDLDGVDLSVAEGASLVLLGESGSGKMRKS